MLDVRAVRASRCCVYACVGVTGDWASVVLFVFGVAALNICQLVRLPLYAHVCACVLLFVASAAACFAARLLPVCKHEVMSRSS